MYNILSVITLFVSLWIFYTSIFMYVSSTIMYQFSRKVTRFNKFSYKFVQCGIISILAILPVPAFKVALVNVIEDIADDFIKQDIS